MRPAIFLSALFAAITLALSLPVEAHGQPSRDLSRGNYGFFLGESLSEVDAIAKNSGYESLGRNDSTGPDGWRGFMFPSTCPVMNITLFLEKGAVNEVSVHFRSDHENVSFERTLTEFRKKYGDEAAIEPEPAGEPIDPSRAINRWNVLRLFWADKKTVIELRADRDREFTVTYHSLAKSAQLIFGTIGKGKRFTFVGE